MAVKKTGYESKAHPFLYYSEAERKSIKSRTKKLPWSRWLNELRSNTSLLTRNAYLWWLEKKPEYARTSLNELINKGIWRDERDYLEPSSHHLADFSSAYDLLAAWGGLTDLQEGIIRQVIEKEAAYYYDVLIKGPVGGANFGNQRVLAASALGIAAIALMDGFDQNRSYGKWLDYACKEIFRPENMAYIRSDGQFIEGNGYSRYMASQLIPFLIAYSRATGINILKKNRLLERWLRFCAYQLGTSGLNALWGTAELGKGFGFFGLLSNREYGAKNRLLWSQVFNLPEQSGFSAYHNHIAMALYEKSLEDPAAEASDSSFAFYQSASVTMRQSWSRDAINIWFAGKASDWPDPSLYDTYSHADTGSFILNAGGEMLVTDSGYDHWVSRDYFGPEFHNVILVDGEGPEQSTSGRLRNVSLDGNVKKATIVTHYEGVALERTVVLSRNAYAIVIDRIQASDLHRYTWQLQSGSKGVPTIIQDDRYTSITWAGARYDGKTVLDGKHALETIVPPYMKAKVGAGRWRPVSDLQEFQNHRLTAEWSGSSGVHVFLLIPRIGSSAPDWRMDASGRINISGRAWSDTIVQDESRVEIINKNKQILFSIIN